MEHKGLTGQSGSSPPSPNMSFAFSLPRRAALAAICFTFVAAACSTTDGELADSETTAVFDSPMAATDGSEPTLGDLVGTQPLVVNFFASWCPPCRAELPAFETVHQAVGSEVAFIGVSHDFDADTWRSFVAESPITYPTYFQPNQEIFEGLGGIGMPTTALIDVDGNVEFVQTGGLDEEGLRDLLAEHLGIT